MILQLHEKLKTKKISAVELTQHYLKRVKTDSNNVYITVCDREAVAAAEKADQALAQGKAGLLTGIPVGIKDIFCTAGVKTTCASKILGDYVPPYDATCVARLKRNGAVLLGKLNMDEFAMGGSNENSAFGPVKNPIDPRYVPGGSSGGSAAAVAGGLAVAALGTDTGGSIRLPASYTGTVGLKPTYGRVSRNGLVAFGSSLDQAGPMTTTVSDAAIVLESISGHDPFDSTSSVLPSENFLASMVTESSRKLKIGLPKEYFVDGLQREVAEQIDSLKNKLLAAGHQLIPITLPHTEYSVAIYYIVAVSEASSNLSRFDGVRFGTRIGGDRSLVEMYKSTRSLFGPEVKRRIILGAFALSSGYYDAYYKKACQVRALVKRDFEDAFKKVDAILAPVAPTTAFKLGEKTADPLTMYLNDIFTIPANLAGIPAISVPIGRDQNKLPIGAQFIGPHFSEARLLALGKLVEEKHYREEVRHGF